MNQHVHAVQYPQLTQRVQLTTDDIFSAKALLSVVACTMRPITTANAALPTKVASMTYLPTDYRGPSALATMVLRGAAHKHAAYIMSVSEVGLISPYPTVVTCTCVHMHPAMCDTSAAHCQSGSG